jgi:hypothetical protein
MAKGFYSENVFGRIISLLSTTVLTGRTTTLGARGGAVG